MAGLTAAEEASCHLQETRMRELARLLDHVARSPVGLGKDYGEVQRLRLAAFTRFDWLSESENPYDQTHAVALGYFESAVTRFHNELHQGA